MIGFADEFHVFVGAPMISPMKTEKMWCYLHIKWDQRNIDLRS